MKRFDGSTRKEGGGGYFFCQAKKNKAKNDGAPYTYCVLVVLASSLGSVGNSPGMKNYHVLSG